MIFASDLDQTLIYSRRAFRLKEGEAEPEITLVETYEEREISFMSNKAIDLLKEVNSKMMFLPVTTRTMEQFMRIAIFQKEIIPSLAVTSNGGNILVNGKADEDWKQHIETKINESSLASEDLLKSFSRLAREDWVLSQRTADELFHYCIVQRDLAPLDELADFRKEIEGQGWRMSLQGRKLYLVPESVNKWDAVAYVKEKMGKTFVAAAGDSLLDLCMLEVADFAIAPLHGELAETSLNLGRHIRRTRRQGIQAAEDILEAVLSSYEARGI
ncbi:haloacid dehalogenase [Peribacillus saganii]|uniref:Haloacid dehalogenase n=1 Tax=Peribacillus saganii TaxID=2303992 RepID=A0A372LND8_9BACI|nr:HAD family hydrolase [Peribacillus saganii]RFU69028.1 haloacid dehalogenase [Peribacillus saganii]